MAIRKYETYKNALWQERNQMKNPKMIQWNYGQLFCMNPAATPLEKNAEFGNMRARIPKTVLLKMWKKLHHWFSETISKHAKNGYDISSQMATKWLYAYPGIEFLLAPLEMATVFWNGASIEVRMQTSPTASGASAQIAQIAFRFSAGTNYIRCAVSLVEWTRNLIHFENHRLCRWR